MNRSNRLITALVVGAGLLIGLPGLAQADDDDWGHVGINFSIGAPVYYGPPAYIYTPPPRVYYYGPPRPIYYENYYSGWRPHGHWRGHGRWHHHEHDDDDD